MLIFPTDDATHWMWRFLAIITFSMAFTSNSLIGWECFVTVCVCVCMCMMLYHHWFFFSSFFCRLSIACESVLVQSSFSFHLIWSFIDEITQFECLSISMWILFLSFSFVSMCFYIFILDFLILFALRSSLVPILYVQNTHFEQVKKKASTSQAISRNET